MASAISHAVAALAIGACFYRPGMPRKVWVLGVACSVLPDFDVVGFRFGIHYEDLLGHRGFTHSIVFAALLAATVVALMFREGLPQPGRRALFAYFFLATASHGFLDAMTDGGLGVGFFSPFSNARYFLPWQRIHVSPIGLSRFFTARAWTVLRSEIIWIWVPAAVLALTAFLAGPALRKQRMTT